MMCLIIQFLWYMTLCQRVTESRRFGTTPYPRLRMSKYPARISVQHSCLYCVCIEYIYIYTYIYIYNYHKHQGLDPLIRSVSTVTVARANASSVFQLFSFLVVCSGMISKRFGFCGILCKCESQFRLYSSILSSMPVIRSSQRM